MLRPVGGMAIEVASFFGVGWRRVWGCAEVLVVDAGKDGVGVRRWSMSLMQCP